MPGIGIGISSVFGSGGAADWAATCTPLNLVLAEITGGVRLTWEQGVKCTNEDGYEIWVAIDGAASALLDTVAADVVTYDDMTDYAGSTVEYKVRAYKGTTYSEYSDEAEITIEAAITNLAVIWAEDHAVLTWDETTGWDTEIYSSRDDTNWTLDETVTTGTETTTNHCWQGTTMYFRARAKNGAVYGPYCASVNIATPLVFKTDQNPRTTLTLSSFELPAGKTVHVDWGDGTSNDYVTTGAAGHNYASAAVQDPYYVQISGDINFITRLYCSSQVIAYGDLSKWVVPAAMIDLRLYGCAFTGDLSSWALHSNIIVCYISANAFTGIPRGELKQIEGVTAGLYMLSCACSTAEIDAFLLYANTYFATNTPIKNSIFKLNGATMGIPTGGNSNANRLGILAKYVAAGYTAEVAVRTV